MTEKQRKKITKMSFEDYLKDEKHYITISDYVNAKLDVLTYKEIEEIIVRFDEIINEKLLKKLIAKVKDEDMVKAFIKHVYYSDKPIITKYRMISYFVLDKVHVTKTGYQKKMISDSHAAIIDLVYEGEKRSDYYPILDLIENKECVFERILATGDVDDKKDNVSNVLLNCKDINDQAALLIAPYVLNQNWIDDQCSYEILLKKVINPTILKHHVLATHDKEIIAYYIFKTRDYELLIKLFENEDKYLDYCSEIWGSSTLMNSIRTFVREDCKYKFVDANIEDYIKSSNEIVDIKIY